MPETPRESLDSLQHKIDDARAEITPPPESPMDEQQGMNQAMRFSVELVAGVAVGSGVGYGLDRLLGTMPLFFIICFFLGAFAGFRNMIRDSRK